MSELSAILKWMNIERNKAGKFSTINIAIFFNADFLAAVFKTDLFLNKGNNLVQVIDET